MFNNLDLHGLQSMAWYILSPPSTVAIELRTSDIPQGSKHRSFEAHFFSHTIRLVSLLDLASQFQVAALGDTL